MYIFLQKNKREYMYIYTLIMNEVINSFFQSKKGINIIYLLNERSNQLRPNK